VVRQIQERHLRRGAVPCRAVPLVVRTSPPVHLAGQELGLAGGERVERFAPLAEQQVRLLVAASPLEEPSRALVVLLLDLDRRQLATVRELHLPGAGHVVADLADRADRVLQREIPHHRVRLDHPQHEVRDADLHERRHSFITSSADDRVEVTAAGVGVNIPRDDRSHAWWRRGLPRGAGAARCRTAP
jgi:hypothetical protein